MVLKILCLGSLAVDTCGHMLIIEQHHIASALRSSLLAGPRGDRAPPAMVWPCPQDWAGSGYPTCLLPEKHGVCSPLGVGNAKENVYNVECCNAGLI